jgi:acyl-coenzyme A thioesterase PaaI-like protein
MLDKSEFIHQQPNSSHCFICGRNNPHGLYMTFFDNGKDEVLCEYTVSEDYQGYPGIVHGGIVAAMMDEAVGRVAMIGDHHHFMFSVKLQVKYRHNVPTQTPLLIRGKVVRLRGRLGKAVGEVILPDGTVAAEAEMTLADVPADIMINANLAALGWYVDSKE